MSGSKESRQENENNRKTVKALGGSDNVIDHVFCKETGQYFIPYNPVLEQAKALHKMGFTGEGTICAVLDTGMMSLHPMLNGRILKSRDFTGEGPEDYNGHGTVIALILVQQSPGAGLLNVKVLDSDKEGLEEDLIRGLVWAEQNGANVINLSLGIARDYDCNGSCDLCREVERIVKDSKITVVCASGNNPGVISCPARSDSVISLGALDYAGEHVAEYSAAADLYEPGTFLLVPYREK